MKKKGQMEYGELIQMAQTNLKAKGAFKNYGLGEGTYLRQGAETNFVNSFNLRYFDHFGFKFRIIDSREASPELTLYNQKLATPILSGALSGMTDITEKPLQKIASGVRDSGSMMWVGIVPPRAGERSPGNGGIEPLPPRRWLPGAGPS